MKRLFLCLILVAGCNSKSLESAKERTQDPYPIASAAPSTSSSKIEFNPVPRHREMVKIDGEYCANVKEHCISYREDPVKNKFARCLEFASSVCLGHKVPMHFYIDKFEYKEKHTQLPMSDVTWNQAKEICESEGRRLCSEEEWIVAAEGPDMYPYTTGLTRPTKECNIDLEKDVVCGKKLCDHRRGIEENPQCVSGYGVFNMAGNVDEFVSVPMYAHSKNPSLWMPSGLKGGHWLPCRARTRPITKDHENKFFHQISIGFRCCKDVEK